MKTGAVAFGMLALAELAAAQSACLSLTSEFPPCAYTCVSSAANAVGCTNTADLACQCNPSSSAAIQGSAINCVLACGGDAAASAIKAGSDICACVATATQPMSSSPSNSMPSGNSASPTSSQPASSGPGSASSSSPITSGPSMSTTTPCMPASMPNCGSYVAQIPSCAQPCFASAAPKVHCDVTDYACQCQSAAQASLSQILPGCIATACPLDSSTLASITNGASRLCACATAKPSGGDCSPTTTPSSMPSGSCDSSSTPGGGGGTVTQPTTVTCTAGCTGQPTGQPTGGGSTAPSVVPTGAGSKHSVGRAGDVIGALWLAFLAL
ncbi:hypothetical protein VHEMI00288 [[Torrubiella] hemipterigena]|uniref:CFEM domain-containing protein n=1 Tax=[Torrubiella] hemipterigena TaxID=1531966 RepID=A0A0A1SIX7_9HYPO|nr:hypothetical protein VHEMI00288 [[Torrubiella] hemipterigena]